MQPSLFHQSNNVRSAWLLELIRSPPSEKFQLDGFDITASNFPAAGWLPSNLKFHTWDAFSEVPSEYIGVFDTVHIRAIYSCIKDNNVEPLLTNLLKLLKPGGYLQWDESDASTISCQVSSPDTKAEGAETIVKIQDMLSRAQSKLLPDWLRDLPKTLESHECENIAHEEFQPANELARAWTDNILLVWRDLIPMMPEKAMPLPPGMGLPESLSRDSYAELFAKAVDECSKGAKLGMVYHVFVARKPT